MMTEQQFAEWALDLSREANVVNGLHRYFVDSCVRLYKTCACFNLLERPLGDVLEIGAFYGYLPFLLRPQCSSYSVLEGDDPAVYPLKPLYQKHQIAFHLTDLFECFGPTHKATHALEFGDERFDTILCWETMEHFSFNPVKFVRELQRVLKPGGSVYITVPNKASFQSLGALIFGKPETSIDSYFEFEDYTSNGKKAFYGFHWREYSRSELQRLFSRAGFKVKQCNTFVAFHVSSKASLARSFARGADILLASLFRRYGTNVYLVAEKYGQR
jgi:SAM-dependent methyltransferase